MGFCTYGNSSETGAGRHCKNCVPPKRHSGCHDTCPEYQSALAEYKDKKAKIEEVRNKYIFMDSYKKERIREARDFSSKKKPKIK